MDDEIELVQKLQGFCRRSGKQVEVYFDNAPAGQARSQTFGRVKAHFVRSGRTADEAIIARLRNLGRTAKNWTVVSSDHQVLAASRSAHAKTISSDDFAGFLLTADSETDFNPARNADLTLDPSEVDEWLEFFNNRGEAASEF